MLTLGTGVGGGLVLGGALYRGWAELGSRRRRRRRPAVPGHLHRPRPPRGRGVRATPPIGPPRSSGARARPPSCSSGGPRRVTRRRSRRSPGSGICSAPAIGSFVNIFGAELVIVGGGFGIAAAEFLFPDGARGRPARGVLEPARAALRIVKAELGSDAGLIGAGPARASRRSRRARCPWRSARRRSATSRTSRCACCASSRRPTSCSARTRGTRRACSTGTASRPGCSATTSTTRRSARPSCCPRLEAGERIALVSDAGLPGVNDPGARLIAAALEAGVAGDGAARARRRSRRRSSRAGSSASATSSSATCRAAEKARGALWAELAAWPHPAVAFESPQRLPATLRSLAAALPERPVAVCRELTKRFEEVVRGLGGGARGAVLRAAEGRDHARRRSRRRRGRAGRRERGARRRASSSSRPACRAARRPTWSRRLARSFP